MRSVVLLRFRRHLLTRPQQRRRSMRSWQRPKEPTSVILRRLRLAERRAEQWRLMLDQNGENQ